MSTKKQKVLAFDINTEVEKVPEKGSKVKTSIYDKPLYDFLKTGKAQVSITNTKVNGVEKTPDYIRQQLLGRIDKVEAFKGIDIRVVGNIVYIFKENPSKAKTPAKKQTPNPDK